MDIIIFVILGLLGFLLINENNTKTKKIKELSEQLEESDKNCRHFARKYSRLKNLGNVDNSIVYSEGTNLFDIEKDEEELFRLIDEFNLSTTKITE